MKKKSNPGKILCYSGDGEGKTSAALGHVIRALGHNQRCLCVFFMKGRETGEIKALRKIGVDVMLAGVPEFDFFNRGKKNAHFAKVQKGFAFARKSIKAKKFDLVVLDEIFNSIYHHELISERELLSLLKSRGSTHIILSGRGIPKGFGRHCDLLTIMQKKKHYFDSDRKTHPALEC